MAADVAVRHAYPLAARKIAPERLVADMCAWFTAHGAEVHELEPVHEDVSFKLPVELRRAERAAA